MPSLSGFDASAVPEQQEFSALPEGQYVMIAIGSELKPTKSGNGEYLQFTLEVLDGPFKGRKIWDRMNIRNPNSTAVDIANRQLAAMCRAVGVIKPNDSAELHNRPMLVTVAIEVDDRRRESNVVKKYDSVSGGAQPAAPMFPPPAAAPAPWAAAQAAVSSAPRSTPPWQK